MSYTNASGQPSSNLAGRAASPLPAAPHGLFLVLKEPIALPRRLALSPRAGAIARLTLVAALTINASGAVPAPEKLLPEDTLAVFTAPDFSRLRELYKSSPQSQFLADPAMKPFRDKFAEKWSTDFIKPLERELGIRLDDYTSLPQGQLTLAVTQNGSQSKADQPPGLLLLLDTRDKSDQLKTNLTALRKKWLDAGRTIRTEKIRDIEFALISVSSNDLPKTIQQFFPSSPPVQELGSDPPPKKDPPSNQLVIGQADSLLILANSTKVAEKIVIHLAGGSLPALADVPTYQADHLALFRDAPVYGWINARMVLEMISRSAVDTKDAETGDPFSSFKLDKVLAASGLAALKSLAFNSQSSPEGVLFHFFLGVPESSRQGLFKILAGEPKECNPPPFVPAEAIKFQRWRIDGQKAWAALEKMVSDISPQALNTVNFLLDTASTAAKEKDPDFDIRKNLIGNLGNDVITYAKAARGSSLAELQSPPSILLIGSPRADQLAASLKSVFAFVAAQAGPPTEREFLGRKIFSVPMPALPLPGAGTAKSASPATLNYTASGGYLALSTESAMIEEYLRSSDSQGKTLRETVGFAEAVQKITGSGTAMMGYANQLETMRTAFDLLKKDPGSVSAAGGFNPIPGAAQISSAQKSVQDWMDFSLLPPFEKVAKYFYFTVYGGSAGANGLTLTMFAPAPPGLKGKPSPPAPAPEK